MSKLQDLHESLVIDATISELVRMVQAYQSGLKGNYEDGTEILGRAKAKAKASINDMYPTEKWPYEVNLDDAYRIVDGYGVDEVNERIKNGDIVGLIGYNGEVVIHMAQSEYMGVRKVSPTEEPY